jgi:HD-GYP domain-containing protein (c-di-GMP phosphodiesterase class II)
MLSTNEIHNNTGRSRKIAAFAAKALVLSAALAVITLLVSPFAAVVAVCAVLWVALFAALRRVRKERAVVDGHVADIRNEYNSIIGVLCGAMNLKDDMNATHTTRVRNLASVVAVELGMREEELRLLQKAAILADIGKIQIAENILSKPGDLSEQEWAEMKRHPEFGHEILSGIVHLRDAGDIVISHHERFDGQGYPRGLKSDDIPLGSRVLSVVDAYIAMTSDRPHRKKMGHDMAIKEILRNSLTQFDPEVVRAFVRCEERGLIDGAPARDEPATIEPEPIRAAGAA